MRENVEFLVQAAIGRNQEQNLRCCLTPLGECGMIPLDQYEHTHTYTKHVNSVSRCLAIELSSIEGGASVCQNQSVNPTICTQNVTLHPCCTGLLGNCSLTTSDNCTFLGGHYHPDKVTTSVYIHNAIYNSSAHYCRLLVVNLVVVALTLFATSPGLHFSLMHRVFVFLQQYSCIEEWWICLLSSYSNCTLAGGLRGG